MSSTTDCRRRVALVWAFPSPLRSITVRYERYVAGFRSLGWESITVCLPEAAQGYEEPVVIAPTEAALRDSSFYRSLGCEVGIVITWLGLPDIVQAMKAAIPWVVSIADNDGQVGERVHPWRTLVHAIHQHRHFGLKVRAAKYWLQKYCFAPQSASEIVRSASSADRITMTSPLAVDRLRDYLLRYARPEIAERITHVPYPVDDNFLKGRVPSATERVNRVVAIGRWDDPQKDADLLAGGIHWASKRLPRTEFVVIGRQSNIVSQRCSGVLDFGVRSPEAIADILRESRVLLLTSRWESGPIVAFEAVASGATVVGPAWVPACQWLAPEGGGIFTRRSAKSVGLALMNELAKWDEGVRDPNIISSHWRQRFDPATVARKMLP